MELFEAIFQRQSTRAFLERQLEEDTLKIILQAGYAAPVGGAKYQTLHFTVIKNQDFLQKYRKSAADFIGKPEVNPLYGAPAFIVVSGETTDTVHYADAGCIIENMCLAATSLGIGSVYIYGSIAALNHDPELLSQMGIPLGYTPLSGIALGYPAAPFKEREIPKDKSATNYLI